MMRSHFENTSLDDEKVYIKMKTQAIFQYIAASIYIYRGRRGDDMRQRYASPS